MFDFLHISFPVPPSFVVVPQIKEVLLDERLELRCTADGIPTPTIHWKRNDIPLQCKSQLNMSQLTYPN